MDQMNEPPHNVSRNSENDWWNNLTEEEKMVKALITKLPKVVVVWRSNSQTINPPTTLNWNVVLKLCHKQENISLMMFLSVVRIFMYCVLSFA